MRSGSSKCLVERPEHPDVWGQSVLGRPALSRCLRTKPWAPEILRARAVERLQVVVDALAIKDAQPQRSLSAELCFHRLHHAARRVGDRALLGNNLAIPQQ